MNEGVVFLVEPARDLDLLHLLARRNVDAELRLERRLLVGGGIQEIDPHEAIEVAERIADCAEPAAFGSKPNDHRTTRSACVRGTLARGVSRASGQQSRRDRSCDPAGEG